MNLKMVQKLWTTFLKIDEECKGYVKADQILTFIEERLYSIVSPFFYRLFDLIDKVEPDRVTFEEFLPSLITYCLFSRDEIYGFVFYMIDEDKNDYISKQDIFKLLMQWRDGFRVFSPNITRSVEMVKIARGDHINIVEFAEIS